MTFSALSRFATLTVNTYLSHQVEIGTGPSRWVEHQKYWHLIAQILGQYDPLPIHKKCHVFASSIRHYIAAIGLTLMPDIASPKSPYPETACIHLNKREYSALRSRLFRHLDGFPIAPTMVSLKSHGILDLFSNNGTVLLENINSECRTNVIFGDPTKFATQLKDEHNVLVQNLLSVRSFLDHNRRYEPPACIEAGRTSRSSGAYAYRGKRINNNLLEQNLVDHFRKWAPLVGKYGLLVLELHTIAPNLAALNIGRTNVTAYDGTHGYSDQYIVEKEIFLSAAKEAGLTPDNRFQARYPNSDLATVTINLLHST